MRILKQSEFQGHGYYRLVNDYVIGVPLCQSKSRFRLALNEFTSRQWSSI